MYEIDGVPLSDPQWRWRLHRETQRRTPVTMRAVDVAIPGVDGSLPIYGENIEQAALALEINVYGSPTEVEARCNFLRGLLGKTHAPLEITRRDGLTAEAKLATLSDPVMSPGYARIAVVLTIPSGTWRGAVTGWEADRLVGSHNVTPLAGGTRPVTDAQILVQGPASGVTLTDDATGAQLRYTGPSLPEGSNLVVDCATWQATRGTGRHWGSPQGNSTEYLANTGHRSATILWTLTPRPSPAGTTWTGITVEASGTTSASGLQIRASSSHL